MGHESMHGVGSPFGSVHVSIMWTIVPYFHLSELLRGFCLQVRLLKSIPIGCHCLISFFHFIFSNFTHTSWTFLVSLLDLDLRLCVSPPLLEGWCPRQCLNTFENISPPTYLFYVVHICWHQVYVLVRF